MKRYTHFYSVKILSQMRMIIRSDFIDLYINIKKSVKKQFHVIILIVQCIFEESHSLFEIFMHKKREEDLIRTRCELLLAVK